LSYHGTALRLPNTTQCFLVNLNAFLMVDWKQDTSACAC
jgi:hypothetical protein